MRLRDRENAGRQHEPAAPVERQAPEVDERHEAAQSLLAAADVAIERALSRNSAEFLAQNRQVGGQ